MRWTSRFTLAVMLTMGCQNSGKNADSDGDGVVARFDCDDTNATVFPDADEICDGIDNDCDGLIDDDDDLDTLTVTPWYTDADGDGYGVTLVGAYCTPPEGLVDVDGDCDDAVFDVNPDAPEICDGLDNDCDGDIDSADPDYAGVDDTPWYLDSDGDGFGSAFTFVEACTQPEGYVADNTDCDDSADGADRYPGAPEICDGKDNNCDIESGLLVDDDDPEVDYTGTPFYYVDDDGDGYGDPATGFQQCEPPPFATVLNGDDCNDDSSLSFPGGVEICDGLDNNCDGVGDADDWMVSTHPYRVPVSVQASTRTGEGVPIVMEIDFGEALAELGDTSTADLDSVIVVNQDCATGFPELPSETVDGLANLFGTGDLTDPLDDGRASVVVLYDEDGDYASVEAMPANVVKSFAVYFGSSDNPASATPLPAETEMAVIPSGTVVTVQTGVSRLVLNERTGGLASNVALNGRGSIAAQSSSAFGNGMLISDSAGQNGEWVNARNDTEGVIDVIHEGTMVSVVSGSGFAEGTHGSFTSRYTWVAFAGRPEFYVKASFILDEESNIGPQSPYWTSAVRPYQIDNEILVDLVGGNAVADLQAFAWAHGSYNNDTYGVFLGYRENPSHIAAPVVVSSGRYLSLAAQQVDAIPSSNQALLATGTRVLDDNTLVVYPHTGTQASATEQFFALARGVTVSTQPSESR